MSVKLDNFVSVNLVRHVSTAINRKFDTAVYVDNDASAAAYYSKNGAGAKTGADKANAKDASVSSDNYIKIFFANGGQYLHVVTDLTQDSDGTCLTNIPTNEIVIFKNASSTVTVWPTNTGSGAQKGLYAGVNQKIYITSVTSASTAIADAQSGQVAKYTTATTGAGTNVAATAAYFTKMDLDNANSVKGYAFTAETVDSTDLVSDNAIVANCIANHMNCDVTLAGATRNIGGDDATSTSDCDLVNLYVRIALQQTLSDRLLTLLTSKIKYDTNGIAAVKAAISSELTKYINNGYISLEKVWTDEDLYIDGELVVASGTTIPGGYAIHVSPFSTLTAAQKAAHQFPSIYIVYADAVDIRKIVVNGEVF